SAHKLVVETAKKMAHELYAEVMHNNGAYADWKNQCADLTPEIAEEKFVELMYPKLLEPARTTLASMLGMRQYEHLHKGIYEALIRDHALRPGRMAPAGRQRLDVDAEGNVKETRH